MNKSLKRNKMSFRCLILGLLLIAVYISGCVCESPTIVSVADDKQVNDTLIFAHVIFRHGDRNINRKYPNDPWGDEVHWPDGGIGQLTKEGKRQQYKLGKYFRRRYAELIGDKYSANTVYIQSTDTDRTIMSALANLAGLFPPTRDEIWNPQIQWHPIPVHTVPKNLDNVLSASKDCPKYNVLFEEYLKNSAEVQRILSEYAHLFSHWTEMCGENIRTITDAYWLYNTLHIEKDHNKTLPKWAEEAIKPNGTMEYIATFDFKTYTDTPELARLKSGFLLKEMLEHFSQKVNSTLEPNRSLWLYSAHDITMTNLLNSLQLYELHIPPYASSLHFELYKTDNDEHYIQIFYRKSDEEQLAPMNIPNCGEKCALDQFQAIYNDIIPGDFDVECRLS